MTSAAQTLRLATASPGLFAVNAAGQGAVLIASSGELVMSTGSIPGRASRPAKRGEYITIYCTGLGAVENQPGSGSPAPGSPLSMVKQTPTVTVGGVSAPVTFAGLAPGFVGLYQVNVQVPESILGGDAVQLVLTAGGSSSNTITIAVESRGFNYADFSTLKGLVLNGNAKQSGNALQLTQDGSLGQNSSAWYASALPIAQGFDSTFTFRMSASSSYRADGICFVLQNAGTNALGNMGGFNLNLPGLGPGVAVAFRTYTYDQIELVACGPNADMNVSCSVATASKNVVDGQAHRVLVHYQPNLIQVSVDGAMLINVNGFNIADKMKLINGMALAGFIGTTGGSSETAEILSWSFSHM